MFTDFLILGILKLSRMKHGTVLRNLYVIIINGLQKKFLRHHISVLLDDFLQIKLFLQNIIAFFF